MKPAPVKTEWTKMKRLLKAKFEKLNDESIEAAKGNLELLSGKLQTVYGYAKEQAEKELASFKASVHAATQPPKAKAKKSAARRPTKKVA